MSKNQILITRYPSRRLYNTDSNEYINVSGIISLLKEGKNIKIIERETNKDLTKYYLIQIITNYESQNGNVLSENTLIDIIKSYNNSATKIMPDLIEKIFEFYKKQQNDFYTYANSSDLNPMFNKSTSDTLKEWQSKQFEYMKQFFNPIQEQSKGNDIIDEKTSINNNDEIESLKKQILEIKKELKKKI